MARVGLSAAEANPHFDIFDEAQRFIDSRDKDPKSEPQQLHELSIANSQNINHTRSDVNQDSLIAHLDKFHITTPPASKPSSRGSRRRPTIESETFVPLDVVEEETSSILDVGNLTATGSPRPTSRRALASSSSSDDNHLATHLLAAAEPNSDARQEIEKHLEGQYQWLMSYPATASSVSDRKPLLGNGASGNSTVARPLEKTIFGCNLVRKRQSSKESPTGQPPVNTYILVATRLSGAGLVPSPQGRTQLVKEEAMDMEACEHTVQLHPPSTPLKAPATFEVMEQAVSPSLTILSERSSSSYLDGSSRAGSFSIPRIEDSFEELDKLEEELEAINAMAQSRRAPDKPDVQSPGKQAALDAPLSPTPKRNSLVGQAATVRASTTKSQPPMRRSASLAFRGNKQTRSDSSAGNTRTQLSRPRSINIQPTSKTPHKSSKLPTVPNFELPGDAVARRLKEKREARLAQQTEAQKTYVPPPRPRSTKPLTKPAFELPGEAISRRRREEREARLKAQEEEERKKREFKARPMRQSLTPSSLPRETITSRARKEAIQEANPEKSSVTQNSKRLSMNGVGRPLASTLPIRSPQARGRPSIIAPTGDNSRGTSTSAGSVTSKRNTLSTAELQHLRLRGKEIFERDDKGFAQDRERARREREEATRLAREQAAERSRAASREWAEKKRRKEQALKEAMRASQR